MSVLWNWRNFVRNVGPPLFSDSWLSLKLKTSIRHVMCCQYLFIYIYILWYSWIALHLLIHVWSCSFYSLVHFVSYSGRNLRFTARVCLLSAFHAFEKDSSYWITTWWLIGHICLFSAIYGCLCLFCRQWCVSKCLFILVSLIGYGIWHSNHSNGIEWPKFNFYKTSEYECHTTWCPLHSPLPSCSPENNAMIYGLSTILKTITV